MKLAQIVSALLEQEKPCQFLLAILQWDAFHGDSKRWREITSQFFYHIDHKTTYQKKATYYLHHISQNNRINISRIQQQKNQTCKNLLRTENPITKENIKNHVEQNIKRVGFQGLNNLYKRRILPKEIDDSLFAVSTLESICKCFVVSKEQLLKSVYKGVLHVEYRYSTVVFNYDEVCSLLEFRCESQQFVETVSPSAEILDLVNKGEIVATYRNKNFYILKSDLNFEYPETINFPSNFLPTLTSNSLPSIDRQTSSLVTTIQQDLGLKVTVFYSFEKVLKELRLEENELKRLVSEGEIRAFRDEGKMKFKKSDIDNLKMRRMLEPTIILPSGEPDDSSEDDEVLLVEEDTSETLLNINDLDFSSTTVPTVDFSSSDFDDSSYASETITEELTFEEDSGSYVLESSDDVLTDSGEVLDVSGDPSGETFIESDTGLQAEPLDIDSDIENADFEADFADSSPLPGTITEESTFKEDYVIEPIDYSSQPFDVSSETGSADFEKDFADSAVDTRGFDIFGQPDQAPKDEDDITISEEGEGAVDIFFQSNLDKIASTDEITLTDKTFIESDTSFFNTSTDGNTASLDDFFNPPDLAFDIQQITDDQNKIDLEGLKHPPDDTFGMTPIGDAIELNEEDQWLVDSDASRESQEWDFDFGPPSSQQPKSEPDSKRSSRRAPSRNLARVRRRRVVTRKHKSRSIISTMIKVITFVPKVVAGITAATFLYVFSTAAYVFVVGFIILKKITASIVNVIKKLLLWLRKKSIKTIAGIEVPLFESLLSEDAGRPGILERTIAQSKALVSVFQITIGLRIVALINLFDNLLEFVAGYINSIYRTWKISKSVKKRLARRDNKKQIQGICDELHIVRYQISRLLCLPHFCPYQGQQNLDEIMALELVLEIRYRLDEMKRDLSILTVKGMKSTAKKSLWDFIKSFIPNPTELIVPWKDFFIFMFFMKYSRRDLYVMYSEVLMSYDYIIINLDSKEQLPIEKYEKNIIAQVNKVYQQKDIEAHIEECRLQIQRIIQMLANAHKMIELRHFTLEDLWLECKVNRNENYHLATRFALEWEKRVNRYVEAHIKHKTKWYKYEKVLFNRRYRLQKKLAAKFI
ncbi:helix-turn-helix domain-containing protein [Candidatus Uabimicrobium sp. HlEnr_7]|uniref:helix-turn-helix domain-containing protein n=1 Tax=Candidatus Uabimicrobium helgolandensis TaxID=3095367 RepID=UPI003557224F